MACHTAKLPYEAPVRSLDYKFVSSILFKNYIECFNTKDDKKNNYNFSSYQRLDSN